MYYISKENVTSTLDVQQRKEASALSVDVWTLAYNMCTLAFSHCTDRLRSNPSSHLQW